MKIDNRIFVVVASPFLAVAFIRFFFWSVGVGVSSDAHGQIAFFCLIFAPLSFAAILFGGDIYLGHTKIGKPEDRK